MFVEGEYTMSETIIRTDEENIYYQPDLLTILGIRKISKEELEKNYPYGIDIDIVPNVNEQ